jgi:hypothetical protein
MNKFLFLIMAVAVMTNYAKAQSYDARAELNFGLKAGINVANVYDSKGEEFSADGKLGFVGGAFVAIPFGTYFGMQPEFLLSQKGFKAKGTLLGSNYGLTRTTTFIDVPLYFTVKPLPELTILAGPVFSYLISRKDEFNTFLGSVEQMQEFENDNIRKNILGAILGLDFNINRIVLGMRAGWDFNTNNGDGTSQTPRYKNTWVQATVGYRFLQ